jgi:hypothetical protein
MPRSVWNERRERMRVGEKSKQAGHMITPQLFLNTSPPNWSGDLCMSIK